MRADSLKMMSEGVMELADAADSSVESILEALVEGGIIDEDDKREVLEYLHLH